ncbi:MAG: DMT family transporter [Polyangiaceae bacterium]
MNSALAGLVAIWLVWGFNWSLWRLALHDTGPLEFIALRTVCATGLLLISMLLLRRDLRPRPFLPLLIIGLSQGVGMNALSVLAVADSGATKATIFAYTMPFWTVLFARLLLQEEIRARQWIAIALGAIGLGVMVAGHSSRLSEIGALLATLGGVSWAIGTVTWKWTIQRYKVDPFVMITWQNIFAVLPLGLAALFAHEMPMRWTGLMTFVFVFNVLITAIVAWVLWFWIVQKLPAVTAGMSSLAIPVVAIASAYLFVGERPTETQWFGILGILLALLVVNLPSSQGSTNISRSAAVRPDP